MNPFFDGISTNNWKNPTPIRMPQGGPNPNLRVTPPSMPKTSPNISSYADTGLGALALGTNIYSMSQQGLNLDTNINPQTDIYGRPVYTAGDLQAQAFAAKPQGATFGEVASSTIQGAQTGAAFGPLGAAVGAAVGLGGSLIGGRSRKRRQTREKNNALNQVSTAQKQYNDSDVSYHNQMNQIEDYNQRINPNRRLRNLYQ